MKTFLLILFGGLMLALSARAENPVPMEATAAQAAAGTRSDVYLSPRRLANGGALQGGAMAAGEQNRSTFMNVKTALRMIASTNANLSRVTFTGGFLPGTNSWTGGTSYTSTYMTDFASLVEADTLGQQFGYSYLGQSDITNILYLFKKVAETNGNVMPSSITINGAGAQSTRDGLYEFIYVAWLHYIKTGAPTEYARYKTFMETCLATENAHISNGLVYVVSTGANDQGWGYTELLAGKGHDLVSSCFRFRALQKLAAMDLANGGSSNAVYTALATATASGLTNVLWNSSSNLFNFSSLVNTQTFCLGSALAVYVGAVDSVKSNLIGAQLIRRLPGGDLDMKGHGIVSVCGAMRYREEPYYFQGSGASTTYQHGGYWYVGFHWLHYAARPFAPEAVDAMVGAAAQTAISSFDTGLMEWYDKTGVPNGVPMLGIFGNNLVMVATNYDRTIVIPQRRDSPQLNGQSLYIGDSNTKRAVTAGVAYIKTIAESSEASLSLDGTASSTVNFNILGVPKYTIYLTADGILHFYDWASDDVMTISPSAVGFVVVPTLANGYSSTATQSGTIASSSNWTNTFGKNVTAYVTAAGATLKDATGATKVTFGAIAAITGVDLHPGWYLTGTTIAGTYVAK